MTMLRIGNGNNAGAKGVKAIAEHLSQLRSAVDTLRLRYSLAPVSWR